MAIEQGNKTAYASTSHPVMVNRNLYLYSTQRGSWDVTPVEGYDGLPHD